MKYSLERITRTKKSHTNGKYVGKEKTITDT